LNQFFSVSSFFLFILVFFTGPDGHLCGSENANGLNKDKILEDMKKLASEDKKIVTQAVKDLAKSGDIRLELFFEMYRQGSIYNWPSKSGEVRIVLNEETLMDDDFNEFAPLLHPISK